MSPSKFPGRILVLGAGAVGGFVGGKLAAAGYDVTLADAWLEHVESIRRNGLTITQPGSTRSVPVRALHVDELPSLPRHSADVAFLCVKLYDTEWAAAIVMPYLKASGCVVTLQNGLVEGIVASQAGWDRTVGCVGSGMYVAIAGPGHVRRSKLAAGKGECVFFVGESQGPRSARADMLAEMLCHVDAAQATDNLWGLRWAKLVANSMTSGLSAACGFGLKRTFGDLRCRRLMLRLAAEAIEVGAALGYATEDVFGLPPGTWLRADAADAPALESVMRVFQRQCEAVTEDAVSGTAQDLRKGKPTEVEFMNGFVASKAAEVQVSARLHAEVASVIRRIEKGLDKADCANAGNLERLIRSGPL